MSTSLVLQPGRIGISVNKMQGYLNLMQQRGMIQTRLVEDGVYGANMSRAVREADAGWHHRRADLGCDHE